MNWKVSEFLLTLSWRGPLSYRNQSIDLRSKSMDCFLYDNSLRHERINATSICLAFALDLSDIFARYRFVRYRFVRQRFVRHRLYFLHADIDSFPIHPFLVSNRSSRWVLKTSWKHILKTSSKHVLKTSWRHVLKTY